MPELAKRFEPHESFLSALYREIEKEIDKYPTVLDIKEYIKILSRDPKAVIFGFFDHDKEGELISKTIKIV